MTGQTQPSQHADIQTSNYSKHAHSRNQWNHKYSQNVELQTSDSSKHAHKHFQWNEYI